MFYDKFYSDNYQELVSYYPSYYREVREMDAILQAHGSIADKLEDSVESVFDNCFIETADLETLKRLEQFLKIVNNGDRNLEERRNLIKAVFLGFGKISCSKIQQIVYACTGIVPKTEFVKEILAIEADLDQDADRQYYLTDVKNILDGKVPAHIAFYILGKYLANVNAEITYDGRLTFTGSFYPRYNEKLLFMDGDWRLDGYYTMDGFQNDHYLDFYPVIFTSKSEIAVVISSAMPTLQLESVFDAEVGTECTVMNMLTEFHPLYPTLRLDGTWDLDGMFMLVGTKTGSSVDSYPVRMSLLSGSKANIRLFNENRIITSAGNHTQAENLMRLSGFFNNSIETGSSIFVETDVAVDNKFGSFLTVEKDLWCLDGNNCLNGSVCLDAEIREYEL